MTVSSASVIYKMLMLIFKVSDILWFKEKNLTDFLKKFNNICNDYSIRQIKWLKKISQYYKRHIHKYIWSLIKIEKDN